MKKVIRDGSGRAIGYMETTKKRGSYVECVNTANFSKQGYVAETMQSLDCDEREYIEDLGKLS